MSRSFRTLLFLILPLAGLAPVTAASSESPYAGQQSRQIKALSDADIEELRAGRGWGFAKAAELNGYPGPVHVLELKDALTRSDAQVAAVTDIFRRMRESAVEMGERYIAAERALDSAFADGSPDAAELDQLVAAAEAARAALRMVHLEAHLLVRPLLTPHQRVRYGQLRGYGNEAGHSHAH